MGKESKDNRNTHLNKNAHINSLSSTSTNTSSVRLLDISDIDAVEYFYRVLENLKYILLVAFACAVLFGLYTFYLIDPVYQTTAKMYLVNTEKSIISVSDLSFGSTMASDYVEIFKLRSMKERVLEYVGADYADAINEARISVQVVSGTHMLYVTASSKDPEGAMVAANAYANVGGDFIEEKMKSDHPTIMELASVPTVPVSPNLSRNVIIAFIVGAAFACAILFVIMLFDDKIKSSEEITKRYNIPVLGLVADKNDKKKGRYYRKSYSGRY